MTKRLLIFALISESILGLSQDEVELVINKTRRVVAGAKPAMVRLTFHDCIGGCDGCLNPDQSKGLERLVSRLEELYQAEALSHVLSRADLWAIMGVWAIQETIRDNNENCTHCPTVPPLQLTYTWGRKDCDTAPYTDQDVSLPTEKLNYQELMTYFSQQFGLIPREVTALMGVHTLGAAHKNISGFDGTWVTYEQNYFNNRYFSQMTNKSLNWRWLRPDCRSVERCPLSLNSSLCSADQVTGWEWRADNEAFNLNADMSLFKDFETNSDGKPSCQYQDCPLSPSARYAIKFAESSDVWITEFSRVYYKMLSNGSNNLRRIER